MVSENLKEEEFNEKSESLNDDYYYRGAVKQLYEY